MEGMGSPAWLTPPVQLHSSREFECGDFTPEQCAYYQQRWHFWYIADHVYALPTIAFFMCAIGLLIIGRCLTQLMECWETTRTLGLWTRVLAGARHLSYRGFRITRLGWNTAPIGVLLLGAIGTMYFFCMDLIPQPYYWESLDFGGSPPLATRSGWMALACMPFVFATASKTNWITLLTGVSHEKLQVFHRWIAYAFFVLSLLHTFPFIVYHIRFHDMVMQFEMGLIFYWTGIVAIIVQVWLTFASFGPFRNLGYEFFKVAHFAGVIIFVLILFLHCDYTLSSWDYFIATAAVYVPCLLYSWMRTMFEHGLKQRAHLSIESNDFIRISIPATFHWVPGQHCFLRFTSFGIHALSSHPFTICSLPSQNSAEPSAIVFYVRKQGGFTTRLYDYAVKHPGTAVPVVVDGPYGGIDTQRFFDSERVVVVAGGSGAGWSLPLVEHFARQPLLRSEPEPDYSDNPDEKKPAIPTTHIKTTDNPNKLRSLRVILATRDSATRAWFHQTVQALLSAYPTPSNLNISIHLTSQPSEPHSTTKDRKDIEASSSASSSHEPSTSSKRNCSIAEDLHGRPYLAELIHNEVTAMSAGESLGIFACGPLDMQNDIRNAAARENLEILKGSKSVSVYLHLEHFSWA